MSNFPRFCVRAVSLENLVSVTDRPVPGILGFGKRTENQNEVPDWRKRPKKSLILEKKKSKSKKIVKQKNVSGIFKISDFFVQKRVVSVK